MCDHMSSNDMTHGYSRRQFITTALAGAGVLAAGTGLTSGAEKSKKKAATKDQAAKGQDGQGPGYRYCDPGPHRHQGHAHRPGHRLERRRTFLGAHALGQEAFTKLVRHSIDQGIAFMDTADLYGSMPYLGRALKGVPQDKYIVMSKIWPRQEFWNAWSGGAKAEVDRFRKELNRDVLDICLIHCMQNSNWPTEFERVRDELSELKQKGVVRAVGISCHDLGAIKVAATHPWTDVILARINNVGKEALMDARARRGGPGPQAGPRQRQSRPGHEDLRGRRADQAGAEGRLAQVRLAEPVGGRDHRRDVAPDRSR